MSYDNSNRGALFRNDRKSADGHADYRGTINVAGRELWIDGFIKTSKNGLKFMALTLRPKEQTAERAPEQRQVPAPTRTPDPNDDIPF